jgi:hypothetical protein
MLDFHLEMVFVIVRPAEQSRYEVLQIGLEEVCR